MLEPWLKFTGICSIVMAIVIFCVIVGGYSSFSRSQNRIETSKSLLTDACKMRQQLLPDLLEIIGSSTNSEADQLRASARKADTMLKQLIESPLPVEPALITVFVNAQEELSHVLAALFSSPLPGLSPERENSLKKLKTEFSRAQDHLFVARKRYNKEVDYFNTRTTVFPGFLIAKIFGFNEVRYTGIANDRLLSGEKTFLPSPS